MSDRDPTTLWELDMQIEKILHEALDYETGEIDPAAVAQLDELEMRQEEKTLNCGLVAQGHQLEAEKILQLSRQMAARAQQHKKKAEWLIEYMDAHSSQDPKFKIEDPRLVVARRKSTRVEISEGLIEKNGELTEEGVETLQEFDGAITTKITNKPSKTELKKLLKGGAEITGVTLETKARLYITAGPQVKDDE